MKSAITHIALTVIGVLLAAALFQGTQSAVEWMVPQVARAAQ